MFQEKATQSKFLAGSICAKGWQSLTTSLFDSNFTVTGRTIMNIIFTLKTQLGHSTLTFPDEKRIKKNIKIIIHFIHIPCTKAKSYIISSCRSLTSLQIKGSQNKGQNTKSKITTSAMVHPLISSLTRVTMEALQNGHVTGWGLEERDWRGWMTLVVVVVVVVTAEGVATGSDWETGTATATGILSSKVGADASALLFLIVIFSCGFWCIMNNLARGKCTMHSVDGL